MTNPIKPLMLADSWRGLSSTGKRMWKQMYDGGGDGTNADAFNEIMLLIYLCPGTEGPHRMYTSLNNFQLTREKLRMRHAPSLQSMPVKSLFNTCQ